MECRTYSTSVLDEFLPIQLVETRNPDEILLCLHQTIPQRFVFPSQRVQYHVRGWIGIRSVEEMGKLRTRSSRDVRRSLAATVQRR